MMQEIVVLGTGGTIAGRSAQPGQDLDYQAGQIAVADLLAAIPAQAVLGERVLRTQQLGQIDSKDMNAALWQGLLRCCLQLLAQESVAGLVITHGTDTLEETAWLLHCLLPQTKPVVLTCAMRPATALAPDGPQNLLDAITLACQPQAPGVWVLAAGVVHTAKQVSKVHPLRVDAFSSGEAGPAAWVQSGQLRWAYGGSPLVFNGAANRGLRGGTAGGAWPRALARVLAGQAWPAVDIVLSHALADGRVVDALVQSGVQALVVAGTGNGTLHQALEAALQRAVAQGVRVCLTSRCPLGVIQPAAPPRWLQVLDVSPVKARISLMLDLLEQA